MLTPFVALLTATSFLSLPVAGGPDACGQLFQKKQQISVTEVARCYDSFPFNPELAKKTLRAVNNILETYAFADLMNNSPNPTFQPNVDVFGQLVKLASTKFNRDRQFHEAVQNIFIQLNDGHTFYTVDCYAQYSFIQPLFMVTEFVKNSDSPKIIVQAYDDTYPLRNKLRLTDFVGAEIISIDGVPAIKALQAYADTYFGVSKDPATRFTQTLSRLDWDEYKPGFSVNRGIFSERERLPEKDFVVYEFKKSSGEVSKVSIPWWVNPFSPDAPFKDAKSYWDSVCLSRQANSDEIREAQIVKKIPIRNLQRQLPILRMSPFQRVPPSVLRGSRISREGEAPLAPKAPKPLAFSSNVAFFAIPSGSRITGILKMSQFDALDVWWINGLKRGFAALKESRAEKIIFDFSGNEGGDVCGAYALLKLITPAEKFTPFKTDIRLGGKMREIVAKAKPGNIFHPDQWLDENGQPFNGSSLIDTPRFKKLPGGLNSTAPYTKFFLDKCEIEWKEDVKKIFPWNLTNVAILTDGMCQSACAIVQNHIKEQTPELRSVVVTGAPKGVQVTPSTLPGGMVYQASYLSNDIKISGMIEQMDVRLPMRSDVYFTLRGAYSRKAPNEVLEYLRSPADIRIDRNLENSLNLEKLWLDAAKAVWN